MASPYTRQNWNDLVQAVNNVLQNPPADTDCTPITPLDEVGPLHRWSKADIRAMQDKLKETCPGISFGPIPELWKQSTIDEIQSAIEQAWCDCEPDEDCDEILAAEEGTTFLILDNGPPVVISNCLGNEQEPKPLCELIEGMVVASAGIAGRRWTVTRINYRNNGTQADTLIAVGDIRCDGTVECLTTVTVSLTSGTNVSCSDCGSEGCAEAIANAEEDLTTNPFTFFSRYFLRVNTGLADCEGC